MNKFFKKSSYTEASLKKERNKLSLIHHPDKGGKESDFIMMNEEYEVVLQQITDGTFQSKSPVNNPEDYLKKYKASDFYQTNTIQKPKSKKQEFIISFLKKYFQNKIFYRIVFFFTATLWYPVALNFGLSEYIIALLYSLPLVFGLYTRIHIFAWFMNLLLSGFIIIKIQIAFMMPYFNFWLFGLIIYTIIYGIATVEDRGGIPTKKGWNEL
jgi:hypothetical protein